MPETKQRTLEELDKIFEAPNPVKASLIPKKLAVDSEGTILASERIGKYAGTASDVETGHV